jgi:hypothetical protein
VNRCRIYIPTTGKPLDAPGLDSQIAGSQTEKPYENLRLTVFYSIFKHSLQLNNAITGILCRL